MAQMSHKLAIYVSLRLTAVIHIFLSIAIFIWCHNDYSSRKREENEFENLPVHHQQIRNWSPAIRQRIQPDGHEFSMNLAVSTRSFGFKRVDCCPPKTKVLKHSCAIKANDTVKLFPCCWVRLGRNPEVFFFADSICLQWPPHLPAAPINSPAAKMIAFLFLQRACPSPISLWFPAAA